MKNLPNPIPRPEGGGGPSSGPLSVRDAAETLGVSPTRIREWIAGGELAAIDVSRESASRRSYRILPPDLDDFVDRRRVTPTPDPRRSAGTRPRLHGVD